MEGKFKIKYSTPEEFKLGVDSWSGLMAEWKNSDTTFDRKYDLHTDSEKLEINLEVITTKEITI